MNSDNIVISRKNYQDQIFTAQDKVRQEGYLNDEQVKALARILNYHRQMSDWTEECNVLQPLLRGVSYAESRSADRIHTGYKPPLPTPSDSPVHHPKHYTSHPTGIECWDIVRWCNFNLGNAFKYLWRSSFAPPERTQAKRIEDLEKCANYVQDEIKRLKGEYDA